MSDTLEEVLAKALHQAGAELGGLVLVLLLVGAPVLVALYVLIRRIASRRGVNLDVQWKAGSLDQRSTPASRPVQATEDDPSQPFDPRRVLVTAYKVLTLTAALALLAGTILAYRAATPGNGLLLLALILGGLSIIAFLSIDKLDRQESEAKTYSGIVDDLLSQVQVSTLHAKPTVYSIDEQGLARAREMSRQGASLDEICRAISDDYAAWPPQQQEAFQRVMQAVLAGSGAT